LRALWFKGAFPTQPQCSEFSLRGDRGLSNAIIGVPARALFPRHPLLPPCKRSGRCYLRFPLRFGCASSPADARYLATRRDVSIDGTMSCLRVFRNIFNTDAGLSRFGRTVVSSESYPQRLSSPLSFPRLERELPRARPKISRYRTQGQEQSMLRWYEWKEAMPLIEFLGSVTERIENNTPNSRVVPQPFDPLERVRQQQ
jgi:hypothetical protein